jgi:hypothetical protein
LAKKADVQSAGRSLLFQSREMVKELRQMSVKVRPGFFQKLPQIRTILLRADSSIVCQSAIANHRHNQSQNA